MKDWHSTWLGRRRLPRELTAFEIEAFFTFSAVERLVLDERRRPELKLGLALQMGFLRMSGRWAARSAPYLRPCGDTSGASSR